MIVNHKHRFIFYHVPKAAGSSIRTALLTIPGSEKPHGSKHVTPAEYQAEWFTRWRTRNYFTFCFVRDPFERFGSAHRYTMQRGRGARHSPTASVNELAEMLSAGVRWVVDMPSMRPQVQYAMHVDLVGRYENLEKDFATICQLIGVTVALPHANSSGDRVGYVDSFTPKTIDILSRVYQEDLDRLGYATRQTITSA